jgi:hypothetical protein
VTATVRWVRPRRRAAAGAIALLGLAVTGRSGRAAEETPPRVIRYDNDVLTVHLNSVPVSEVLQEVAVQSGAEVRGQVREAHDVTASFESVPLPDALSRLLGDQAFALVYDKAGHLKAVRLLGSDAVLAKAAPAPPAQKAPFPGDLPALIDRHPPVPVSGAVADAIRSESASLWRLLDLALHHQDPTVRAEALKTGVAAIESDRELYVAVIGELDDADSALLANLLRDSAGGNAQEVAAQVMQDAQSAQLRLKASSVSQRLRRGN